MCTRFLPAVALPVMAVAHFGARKLFPGIFERRVFLPDHLIQSGRAHSRFLQLRVGPSCFDRLMLPRVAYEQHAVVFSQLFNKRVHLLCLEVGYGFLP